MTLHPTVLRDLAADHTSELYAQRRRTSAVAGARDGRHLPPKAARALSRPLLHLGWSMVELGLRLGTGSRLPRTVRG